MSVLDHTLAIGTYMSGFYDYLCGKGSEPRAPPVWHANLLHLCIHTVKIVHSASQNPGVLARPGLRILFTYSTIQSDMTLMLIGFLRVWPEICSIA